jgi:polysaccharide biosynthesis protein PslG
MTRKLLFLTVALLSGALLALGAYAQDSNAKPHPKKSPSAPAAEPDPRGVGIHATLRWLGPDDIAATADELRAAGIEYAREDFHWHWVEGTRGSYDWSRYDTLVRETAKRGVKLIAILNSPPAWATASTVTPPTGGSSLTAYVEFVRRAVARYGTEGTFWTANPGVPKQPIRLWNVWNEPWGYWFWKGSTPDGGTYARMFKAVVQGARTADPQARFMADVEMRQVTSPETPPASYVHAMFDAVPDLAEYMDTVSVHPYSPYDAPTACTPRTDRGIREDWKATMFQFCRLLDLRRILDARGASSTRIWVTEMGFSTAPNGAWGTVTEAQQEQYVHDVFRMLRDWKVADGVVWYAYRDSANPNPNDREHWFGLRRADGSAKPAWNAFVDELTAGW